MFARAWYMLIFLVNRIREELEANSILFCCEWDVLLKRTRMNVQTTWIVATPEGSLPCAWWNADNLESWGGDSWHWCEIRSRVTTSRLPWSHLRPNLRRSTQHGRNFNLPVTFESLRHSAYFPLSPSLILCDWIYDFINSPWWAPVTTWERDTLHVTKANGVQHLLLMFATIKYISICKWNGWLKKPYLSTITNDYQFDWQLEKP